MPGHSNKYKYTQTHSKFIWYVLLTYNKYISSSTILVILFIYLLLFKKKRKKKSKTWPLTTYLKKIMGLSFSVKLHLYLTGLNFNTLWVKKIYLYINEVELFISHSLVTKTGMSDNQERGGCKSS